jgi:hypothetical protein
MAGLILWGGFNLLQITSQNSPISLVPNLIKLTTRLKRGLQEEDGDQTRRETKMEILWGERAPTRGTDCGREKP